MWKHNYFNDFMSNFIINQLHSENRSIHAMYYDSFPKDKKPSTSESICINHFRNVIICLTHNSKNYVSLWEAWVLWQENVELDDKLCIFISGGMDIIENFIFDKRH